MIGVALTKVALRDGTEIYAIVRPDTKRNDRLISSPKVHVVNGSLEELDRITEIPTDCDVLYHFAWTGTARKERDDPVVQERNITHTLAAVELAKRCGCNRFVGAGSQAEYGPVEGIIDAETKCAPATAYGAAKLAAGVLSRRLCVLYGIAHIWGRIFSVYGPHDSNGTMLDDALKAFARKEIAHFSAATQTWNYLYEDDAGEFFLRFGQADTPAGTYLVASDESRPLREYIETVMQLFGGEARAVFASKNGEGVYGLNVNNKKTLQTIGYRPVVSFQEGAQRMKEARSEEGVERRIRGGTDDRP